MPIKELSLFPDTEWELPPERKPLRGGSQNPIVFHDYESYIAKFNTKPDRAKTTDDTYTPQDVYEAVLTYVREVCPMEGKAVLRPFYPGGDYRRAEYPADGVVVDNPPFSIFSEIVGWYTQQRIPFFLFGPGMTMGSVTRHCTLVVAGAAVTFSNGAEVSVNFATNLLPHEVMITTACRLRRLIEACPSQGPRTAKLPKYRYPDNLLSVSLFQTIARGEEDFAVTRSAVRPVKHLGPERKQLFGLHWLTDDRTAARAAAARAAAARAAAARAAAARGEIAVELSAEERGIVEELNNQQQSTNEQENGKESRLEQE